jgi:hypothetical protein
VAISRARPALAFQSRASLSRTSPVPGLCPALGTMLLLPAVARLRALVGPGQMCRLPVARLTVAAPMSLVLPSALSRAPRRSVPTEQSMCYFTGRQECLCKLRMTTKSLTLSSLTIRKYILCSEVCCDCLIGCAKPLSYFRLVPLV